MPLLLILLLWLSPGLSSAWSEQDDIRWRELNEELRCLVCQNQSIAESAAPLAQDLRRQVRQMIEAGRSDQEIRLYMTERYGDFVLYRPPFKSTTYLLWLGPLLMLLLGVLLVWRLRLASGQPQPVADAEALHARASRALKEFQDD